MDASVSSSPLPVLLLLLLLLHGFLAVEASVNGGKMAPFSLALPLRAQKALPLSSANKLLFRHNVSLTVALAVGTPSQNVSMVLDTGSELSWILCNTSGGAGFEPRRSASYSAVRCGSSTCRDRGRDLPMPPVCEAGASPSGACRVYLSYADASTAEGALATDVFRVGRAGPTPTVFGCVSSAYSSAADGDSGTAGILGMNRGSLSFVTQSSIRRFSYCIPDRETAGVLLLGAAAPPPFLLPPLNYTPLVQISLPLPYFDRVAYSVQLDGIRVGGALLSIPKSVLVPDHTGAGQTVVDSGSQFTFLLGPVYEALKAEFSRQTQGRLAPLGEPDFVFQGAMDTCFRLKSTAPPPRGLPGVALLLQGGAEVAIEGERVLYRAEGETRGGGDAVWCLSFGNSDLVPMSAYVIGHHHQQNVWVEYDLENRRVGFAPAQCDRASRILGVS